MSELFFPKLANLALANTRLRSSPAARKSSPTSKELFEPSRSFLLHFWHLLQKDPYNEVFLGTYIHVPRSSRIELCSAGTRDLFLAYVTIHSSSCPSSFDQPWPTIYQWQIRNHLWLILRVSLKKISRRSNFELKWFHYSIYPYHYFHHGHKIALQMRQTQMSN